MNAVKTIILIAVALLQVSFLNATEASDIEQDIESVKTDTAKLKLLLSRAKNLYPSDQEKAIDMGNRARQLAQSLNMTANEALALKYIGLAYYYQGEYLKVIINWTEALKLYETIGDKKGVANLLSNLGAVYNNQGDDGKAIEHYNKALLIAETIGDTTRKIYTLNNIALIYAKKQATHDVALQNYEHSLELSKLVGNQDGIGTASLNIGEVYYAQKDFKKALKYFEQALEAYWITNTVHIADALSNIGKIHLQLHDYKTAIDFQEKSLAIAEKLGAKYEMAKALMSLGEAYYASGNNRKAMINYIKASELANKLDARYLKQESYQKLGELYSKYGDYKQAYYYLNMASIEKDTINSERNKELVNQIRVQHEVQDMQQENELLKKDIEIKEVKGKTQKVLIIFLIIGFLITSSFIALLFRANREKRRANNSLKDKNKLISHQQREILDSILYAKRIQLAAIPHNEILTDNTSDNFILFKPKDVVSGDFYWFTEVENHLVVTVADCTGHGVPGAFMSMLGMSFLKLIVEKEYITKPDIILRRLRKEVVKALGQTGQAGEQKDGMDMTLCSIDLETLELEWAGANNPFLMVRNGELIEIKPDKMPIAIYEKMDRYTLHTKQLQKGDIIYLITDGYPDQFGGPKDRKFMSKNLKQLLVEISERPMDEQKKILETAISEWMFGHDRQYKQTDDITIMGMKI